MRDKLPHEGRGCCYALALLRRTEIRYLRHLAFRYIRYCFLDVYMFGFHLDIEMSFFKLSRHHVVEYRHRSKIINYVCSCELTQPLRYINMASRLSPSERLRSYRHDNATKQTCTRSRPTLILDVHT